LTDDFPTARTHLEAGWLVEFVWCKACHHQGPADLQAIVDAGRREVPLKDLKFRCAKLPKKTARYDNQSRSSPPSLCPI